MVSRSIAFSAFLLLLGACSPTVSPSVIPSSPSSSGSTAQETSSIKLENSYTSAISSSSSAPDHIIDTLESEPVRFAFIDLPFKIQKWVKPANEGVLLDVIAASGRGDKCGSPLSPERQNALEAAFKGKEENLYKIIDPAAREYSDVDLYSITVLPNAMEYRNVREVKNDFQVCAAGSMSILEVNDRWMLFAMSACNGGSGHVDRCDAVAQAIRGSIRLQGPSID